MLAARQLATATIGTVMMFIALIHIQMTQIIQKLIELIFKGPNLISTGNCHSKILYFIVFVI
jgi:hypothetical protein